MPCSRSPSRRTIVASVMSVGAALALTACGSASPEAVPNRSNGDLTGKQCCVAAAHEGSTVVNGIDAVHNGWDIAFINYMAPHDDVASQMAALAVTRATSRRVQDLAAQIDQAQGPRYQAMAAMAGAWGEPVPSTDPSASASLHDHGDGDSDSAAGKVATLLPLTGPAFDKKFLTIMIAHHRATLPTALATSENGTNPQARKLARALVATQRTEIGEMEQLLAPR